MHSKTEDHKMEICLIENRTLIKDKVEVAKTLNKYFVSSCGLVSNFDVIVLAIREQLNSTDVRYSEKSECKQNDYQIVEVRRTLSALFRGTRRAAETSSYPPNQEFLKKTAFRNRKSKEISRNVLSACGRLRPPFRINKPAFGAQNETYESMRQ